MGAGVFKVPLTGHINNSSRPFGAVYKMPPYGGIKIIPALSGGI